MTRYVDVSIPLGSDDNQLRILNFELSFGKLNHAMVIYDWLKITYLLLDKQKRNNVPRLFVYFNFGYICHRMD